LSCGVFFCCHCPAVHTMNKVGVFW
jgi:hypothetical protein